MTASAVTSLVDVKTLKGRRGRGGGRRRRKVRTPSPPGVAGDEAQSHRGHPGGGYAPPGEVDPLHRLGEDLGPAPDRLLAAAVHEIDAHDALGPPREVLDLRLGGWGRGQRRHDGGGVPGTGGLAWTHQRRHRQLAAGGDVAGHEALEHQRLELRAGRVDRRSVAGWAAANDAHGRGELLPVDGLADFIAARRRRVRQESGGRSEAYRRIKSIGRAAAPVPARKQPWPRRRAAQPPPVGDNPESECHCERSASTRLDARISRRSFF